ncbi:hypothetical protein DA075_06595 [Methylobacterium currus]|uniref:Uncharacterized protein n=1 Tax=Methylobacterium currus TaxID=2051553 RepID=A0A2R4WGH0_9HYPH|nr:hypothetical protein [Methylobacterium currus]AWB20632.1 hypothetical protein DA075_06595 [Methylobacterium currus]
MPGAQDLVRAKIALAVDQSGSIVPIKNTRGALTRQATVESFVQALDHEHRQMLVDALTAHVQVQHSASLNTQARRNLE